MLVVLATLAAHARDTPAPTVDGSVWIHIRPEARINPSFDRNIDDDFVGVTQNARGSLVAHRGLIHARVDLQGVYQWGARAGSTSTAAEAYPHQGYLEVGDARRWVRIGRQELHILNGFYLSAAPWNVAGRSFDALRAHWANDAVEFDLIGAVEGISRPVSADLPDGTLGDGFGAFFATFTVNDDVKPSVWVYGRGEGPNVERPDRSKAWVGPGARLFATPGDTTVDLNAMAMVGEDTGVPMRGYSVIARVDQDIGRVAVAGIFDQSSGHACEGQPADGVCGTDTIRNFDLAYGRNHFLRGNADQVHGANIRDLALEAGVRVTDKVKPFVQAHLFQLTDPEGLWMRNGGRPQGQGWLPGNTDPNLGIEIDALVWWEPQEGAVIDGGYCLFAPTGAGAEITGGDPQHYVFLRNRFTF